MVDTTEQSKLFSDALVSIFSDAETPLQTVLQLVSDAMGAAPEFVVGALKQYRRELPNGEPVVTRMMITVPAHNLRGLPPVEGWYCDPNLTVPMQHALSGGRSAIFVCLYGDLDNYERLIIELVTMMSIHNPNFKGTNQ